MARDRDCIKKELNKCYVFLKVILILTSEEENAFNDEQQHAIH
jgi:hypothetical protein